MSGDRFGTFVFVTDVFIADVGDGLKEHLAHAFGDAAKAHGGTHPVMEDAHPMSADEVEMARLAKHERGTWYRLTGRAQKGS